MKVESLIRKVLRKEVVLVEGVVYAPIAAVEEVSKIKQLKTIVNLAITVAKLAKLIHSWIVFLTTLNSR